MPIDAKHVELINADIDGEISSADKAELEAYLANSPEAQALHAELAALSVSLDGLPDLECPPHLKHTIMASMPQATPSQRSDGANGSSFLQSLFALRAVKYVATFAAGAILTLSLISSDQASRRAFDDVTTLVGTISDSVPRGPGVHTTHIDRKEVAGIVTLHSSGPILIVDFDLVSSGPIEIVASYSDKTIWFNGFAQLESAGASISAQSGRVAMQINGKRRYAIFLHNAGDRDITIKLKFMANGETIYDTDIEYVQPGDSG